MTRLADHQLASAYVDVNTSLHELMLAIDAHIREERVQTVRRVAEAITPYVTREHRAGVARLVERLMEQERSR